MTAPQPGISPAIGAAPAQPTVLDALRASPVGPLLDQPLPQIPALGLPELPPLPPLPQLPPLPPLPGIDQLLAPFNDLASGFGTGVFGALDPTQILDQSSQLIDGAMQLGKSGLSALDQVWQGLAADNAQQQGRTMQTDGADSSQQSTDIATVTREAAAVVQRGNAELTAIGEAFVAKASAFVPVALTPPGQAALIATATESLGQALAVVSRTRGELAGHTAAMAALAGPLLGSGTGESPMAIASRVIESVGEPVVSTVTDGVRTITESPLFSGATEGDEASANGTHAAGVGGGHLGGSGGGIGGGPGSAPLSAPSAGGNAAATAVPWGPASATAAAGVLGAAPGGMMGPMAGARTAGGGEDTVRNSAGYLNTVTDPNGVVGDLPQVVSPVLGAGYDDL